VVNAGTLRTSFCCMVLASSLYSEHDMCYVDTTDLSRELDVVVTLGTCQCIWFKQLHGLFWKQQAPLRAIKKPILNRVRPCVMLFCGITLGLQHSGDGRTSDKPRQPRIPNDSLLLVMVSASSLLLLPKHRCIPFRCFELQVVCASHSGMLLIPVLNRSHR
jgi:hypothetical protein